MGIPLLLFRQPKKKIVSSAPVVSPLLNGLTHYWKLDELTGDRLDTVGAFTMTPSGAVGYEAGKLGNAATFAGSPNYLWNNGNGLNIPETGVTVWGWIKIVSDARATVITQVTGTNLNNQSRWYLIYMGSNSWQFTIRDSDAVSLSTATITQAPTLDKWYFFCGRYNSSTKKTEARLDASAWVVATNALPNGPIQLSGTNYFSMNRNATSYGTCSLDSIGFSERYYTDGEVSLLYNGGAGLEYPF